MNKIWVYGLVFIGSFSLMVMELTAGRLVAPYVGSSIYTWTSIIGIFLLGITLGNWLGGRLADALPRRWLFGPIFLLSALSSLGIIFIAPTWGQLSRTDLFLPMAISIFSLLTFFPVAFFLSFISPLGIKLVLQRLEQTGRTIGNIYGVSAAGSILGTFLAGFWLIPSFGTKEVVWSISFLLAGISFYFLAGRGRRKLILGVMLLAAGFVSWWAVGRLDTCLKESQYYCIRVSEFTVEGVRGLALTLDQLEHSHIFPSEADPFGDDYVRLFAMLLGYRFNPQDQFKVLAIGGGGYVLPRYIINNYPRAMVTVLEIDPEVTAINFSRTGLKPDSRLKIIHGDARLSLNRLEGEQFDVVFGDAFNDFLVPFHLTTREFVEKIRASLREGGFYAINLIDDVRSGQFFSSSLLTVAAVFPQTRFFTFSPQWEERSLRQNAVILGMTWPWDETKWLSVVPVNDPRWTKADPQALLNIKFNLSIRDGGIKEFNRRAQGLILTDNFAPLDSMLANLYRRRY